MKVKVKMLAENAKLPTKAHESDFGYDVFATSCEEVEPGVWKYGLGIAFEIVRDELKVGTTKMTMGSEPYYDEGVGVCVSNPTTW